MRDLSLSVDFQKAHLDAIEQINEVLLRTHTEGYARACEAPPDFDVREAVKRIDKAVRSIARRCDAGTLPASMQTAANVIPGYRFALLEADHPAPVEQSHGFAALLETFPATRV